jgi:hypothetical protein
MNYELCSPLPPLHEEEEEEEEEEAYPAMKSLQVYNLRHEKRINFSS